MHIFKKKKVYFPVKKNPKPKEPTNTKSLKISPQTPENKIFTKPLVLFNSFK